MEERKKRRERRDEGGGAGTLTILINDGQPREEKSEGARVTPCIFYSARARPSRFVSASSSYTLPLPCCCLRRGAPGREGWGRGWRRTRE